MIMREIYLFSIHHIHYYPPFEHLCQSRLHRKVRRRAIVVGECRLLSGVTHFQISLPTARGRQRRCRTILMTQTSNAKESKPPREEKNSPIRLAPKSHSMTPHQKERILLVSGPKADASQAIGGDLIHWISRYLVCQESVRLRLLQLEVSGTEKHSCGFIKFHGTTNFDLSFVFIHFPLSFRTQLAAYQISPQGNIRLERHDIKLLDALLEPCR